MLTKGKSRFYVMSNNGIAPQRTGGTHWLEYMPGFAYCFLPSLEAFKGEPSVYTYVPDFVRDFQYYMDIQEVWKLYCKYVL